MDKSKNLFIKILLVLLFCLNLSLFLISSAPLARANSTQTWVYRPNRDIYSVAISSDGNFFAIAEYDTVCYFNKSGTTPMWKYQTTSYLRTIAISANGSYITAGTMDGKVHFFRNDSANPLWTHDHPGAQVFSIAMTPDGKYIVEGRGDNWVYYYNSSVENPKTPMWSYQIPTGGNVKSLSISSDGYYIAVGNDDHNVYLFNSSITEPKKPMLSYDTGGYVYSVAFSSDGNYFVAGSGSSKVILFNMSSSNPNIPEWTYNTSNPVLNVDTNPNGEYIIASTTSIDGKLFLFHNSKTDPIWNYTANNQITSLSFSNNSDFIIAGDYDGYIYYFFKSNPFPIWTNLTESGINSVDIAHNGDYIVAGNSHAVYFTYIPDPNLSISNISSDLSYEYGTKGHKISLTVLDYSTYEPTYVIYRNSVELLNDSWISGVPINISVDGLYLGEYNYTIKVSDGLGKFVEETRIIEVYNIAPYISGSSTHITYEYGTTGNEIYWIINDNSVLNPTFDLYVNDSLIHTRTWTTGMQVTMKLENLEVGLHKFTIVAKDGLGGISHYSITVEVVKVQEQHIGYQFPLISILIIILSAVGVISGFFLFKIYKPKIKMREKVKRSRVFSRRSSYPIEAEQAPEQLNDKLDVRFCVYCGNELKKDEVICSKCGSENKTQ